VTTCLHFPLTLEIRCHTIISTGFVAPGCFSLPNASRTL
jgi:hypothetical protein